MENQPPKPVVTILVGAPGAGKSGGLSDNRDKIDEPYMDIDATKNSLGEPKEDLHWELAKAARKRMIAAGVLALVGVNLALFALWLLRTGYRLKA